MLTVMVSDETWRRLEALAAGIGRTMACQAHEASGAAVEDNFDATAVA